MMQDIPYDQPFSEFLIYLRKAYPKAQYGEAFIPIIAHKATAGYVIQKHFPELMPEFMRLNGQFAYAISEPNWGNSPLNIKSTLKENTDGTFELYANKSFVLDGDIGIFVAQKITPLNDENPAKEAKTFALVIVDTDCYRTTRTALGTPEATYRVDENTYMTHYRCEFTVTLHNALFTPISKREILMLARTIVFREQVAYAVLAYLEAAKYADMKATLSRVELLCQRAKEEPGQDDIAVAREILSASVIRILDRTDAHPFWKWLSRFIKPT
ncbi:MAG TPA: hypothetical protein PLY93_12770 [Turneriella sp.]|nr:hypothetical protein [Turneriella sp.]